MTSSQIQLVTQSFAQLAPRANEFGRAFYDRLFELDPALRPLFKNDIDSQIGKLLQMLIAVVHNLDHVEQLVPVIQSLGSRHAGYGVTEEHYQTVASALLWALERELGTAFTPEVRDAWIAAYTLIAETMQSALPR